MNPMSDEREPLGEAMLSAGTDDNPDQRIPPDNVISLSGEEFANAVKERVDLLKSTPETILAKHINTHTRQLELVNNELTRAEASFQVHVEAMESELQERLSARTLQINDLHEINKEDSRTTLGKIAKLKKEHEVDMAAHSVHKDCIESFLATAASPIEDTNLRKNSQPQESVTNDG